MTCRSLGRMIAVVATLALVLPLFLVSGCSSSAPDRAAPRVVQSSAVGQAHVVAISLDGLNPRAIVRLGRAKLPHLHRLFDEGAGTLNARTQVEQTVTLPNHTSMVTGRRIDASRGGHGVTWNRHRPGTTVQRAAGHDVSSVFRVVHAAGRSTSMFSTKVKFSLFDRSWPRGIDRAVIREEDDATLTALFRQDLVANDRAFAFLHLGLADQTGHARGWMGSAYLAAVVRLDGLVGQVLATIESTPRLASSTVVILTADHGGVPGLREHEAATRYDNYRIPFVVWGTGVSHANLYRLNPAYRDPGTARPRFSGPQPIRNGDLANLATDVLGLGPVPGSLWNRRQLLIWHR